MEECGRLFCRVDPLLLNGSMIDVTWKLGVPRRIEPEAMREEIPAQRNKDGPSGDEDRDENATDRFDLDSDFHTSNAVPRESVSDQQREPIVLEKSRQRAAGRSCRRAALPGR